MIIVTSANEFTNRAKTLSQGKQARFLLHHRSDAADLSITQQSKDPLNTAARNSSSAAQASTARGDDLHINEL